MMTVSSASGATIRVAPCVLRNRAEAGGGLERTYALRGYPTPCSKGSRAAHSGAGLAGPPHALSELQTLGC